MGCSCSSATRAAAAAAPGEFSGTFAVGEHVYFAGMPDNRKLGARPHFGEEGQVVGQTLRGKVAVKFGDKNSRVTVKPTELSRNQPMIPGGFALDDTVYYGGPARKYPNGDQLQFGDMGKVAGRSCVGDGLDGERLAVVFENHQDAKAIRLAVLSREAPIIPGGYSLGDKVYWCGMHWTFPNGDKLKFGWEGQVAGRSSVGDGRDDERVAVNFVGNKGAVAMRLPEISHEVPVIPGGYSIGDRVFYCYPNWRAPDGHTLKFGVLGKVIGRSCVGDGKDDERVWVLFPGMGYGCICLEQICREKPVIPGGYSLGDKVYYRGPSRAVSMNGDQLKFGAMGEITGKATKVVRSGRLDVAVLFPGNDDDTDLGLAEISRDAPVIPGGFKLHEEVFYGGKDWKYANGDQLVYGAKGKIAGCSCQGDEGDKLHVAVLLTGNRSAAQIPISDLFNAPPARLAEVLERRLKAAFQGESWQDANVQQKENSSPSCMFGTSSPSTRSESESQKRIPNLTELAVCYQTAVGAGVESVAQAAEKACMEQVTKAQSTEDILLLSELRRAAEDVEWQDLWVVADKVLEEVTLPKALASADAAGDLFGLIAIEQRAVAKGWSVLAERATQAIEAHQTPQPELLKVRSNLRKAANGMTATPSSLHVKTIEKGENLDPSSEQLLADMQTLLDETYTGWGGFGRRTRTRDRPNERVAERLEVERVVQLRNIDSYISYLVRRQVVSEELPDGCRRDWNVRTKSESSPVSTASSAQGGLSRRSNLGALDPDLNEHFLWHGTGPWEAAGIAARGFDIDHAGTCRGSLFGRGLYFAESCLKADEYVRPDEGGAFPLILCRVTLGNVNYCDAEDPWELREHLRVSCRPGIGGHHSVLGDREKVRQTFREFVVFDGHQAYPEYIVWYTRK